MNSVQPNLATSIPNLTTLVLTSNNFAELADLDALKNFSRLTHLTMLENPVTRREVRANSRDMGTLRFYKVDRVHAALSVLDHLALLNDSIFRLPKGEGCGANKSYGALWYSQRTVGISVKSQ